MPNPYRPAIDALSGQISTENARRVIDYVAGLPELIEAISARLTRDGHAYVDDFPSDPQAGEVAVALGVQMRRIGDLVAAFQEVFRRVHARDLRRIDEPRRFEERWDVMQNRE